MCDYSLHSIRNRLAVEGDRLKIHRFQTGSIGLAPAPDIAAEAEREANQGFWRKFFRLGPKPYQPACAVCIPPGARLLVHDIPARMQADLQIGETEEVTFTQLTARENAYRDAFRFDNGLAVLLQHFQPGQQVELLMLFAEEAENDPELQEIVA